MESKADTVFHALCSTSEGSSSPPLEGWLKAGVVYTQMQNHPALRAPLQRRGRRAQPQENKKIPQGMDYPPGFK